MAETKKNNATKKDVEIAQASQNTPQEVKQPMKKFGTQEVYEATDGTKYKFQFPGVRKAQQIIDDSRNGYGLVVTGSYYEELWENVIMEPKVDWDYWEEHEGYQEVMSACDRFLGSLL